MIEVVVIVSGGYVCILCFSMIVDACALKTICILIVADEIGHVTDAGSDFQICVKLRYGAVVERDGHQSIHIFSGNIGIGCTYSFTGYFLGFIYPVPFLGAEVVDFTKSGASIFVVILSYYLVLILSSVGVIYTNPKPIVTLSAIRPMPHSIPKCWSNVPRDLSA